MIGRVVKLVNHEKITAMLGDLLTTTFPIREEFCKAVAALKTIGAPYEVIKPSPALALVALPALVMSREVRGTLEVMAPNIVFSGWVDYRSATAEMPGPVFITATFIGYKVLGVKGALAATFAVFTSSLTLMIALSGLHGKVNNSKLVQTIVKGFLSGFIGLLVSVTLQFALKSLLSWQAWLIFIASLIAILYYKKDVLWAILGTVLFSILFV